MTKCISESVRVALFVRFSSAFERKFHTFSLKRERGSPFRFLLSHNRLSTMTAGKKAFERLPKDVVPSNYALRLKPNLSQFTFEGSEEISLEVSFISLPPQQIFEFFLGFPELRLPKT